jgi:hypothetical protein
MGEILGENLFVRDFARKSAMYGGSRLHKWKPQIAALRSSFLYKQNQPSPQNESCKSLPFSHAMCNPGRLFGAQLFHDP